MRNEKLDPVKVVCWECNTVVEHVLSMSLSAALRPCKVLIGFSFFLSMCILFSHVITKYPKIIAIFLRQDLSLA